MTESELLALIDERDELLKELTLAVSHCDNLYWFEGHGPRVCARWGIPDPADQGEPEESHDW
jgi:hypothetical protein